MTDQHFLIVHEDPADGMDIEHPESCPTATAYEGRVVRHVCEVGGIEFVGEVDLYFRHSEQPATGWLQAASAVVTVGRHPIEYWSETTRTQFGVPEFDCGLRLTAGHEAAQ